MNHSGGKYSFEEITNALSSPCKWKSIQSTIYLAFISIAETLKQHESCIHDLELQLSNKASRHELKSELSNKPSIQDVSEKFSHYSSILDAKLVMLDEKVTHSDVQKLISDRVKYDELKKILEPKASVKELNFEIDKIYTQIDKIYEEICESLARLPNNKEIEFFNQELKIRPNTAQFEEMIGKKMEGVNKILKNKVDKADLANKIGQNDLKSIVGVLENKADVDCVDKILSRLEKLEKNENNYKKRIDKHIKDSVDEVKKLTITDIDTKMSKHIFEIDKHMSDLNKELQHVRTNPLSKIPEIDHLTKKINENAEWFEQELEDVKDQLKDLFSTYKNEISIEKANSRDIITQKFETVENLFKKYEKDINALYSELSLLSNYVPTIKSIDEKMNNYVNIKIKELINTYAGNYQEIQIIKENLVRKAEAVEVENLIHEKNKMIINNLCEIKEEIKFKLHQIQADVLKKAQEMCFKVYEEKNIDFFFSVKADKKDVESLNHELRDFKILQDKITEELYNNNTKLIENLTNDFNEKYNSIVIELRDKTWSSEIVKQIDSKPDVKEINKALLSIQNEIDEKLTSQEFQRFSSENNIILNTLCAEICVGRWLWKSGDLKEKLVVWDEENTNTNPLLFIWEPHRNFILVEDPGIYEVSFAVFSGDRIELIINGHQAVSMEGSKSTEFSGNSLIDFVIVPSRSRISLKFWGETGQGFMSLRKL